MLRLNKYDLQTNFSVRYVFKTSVQDVQYSDRNIVTRVEEVTKFKFLKIAHLLIDLLQYLNGFMQCSSNRKFLDKEVIVNDFRMHYPEYNRKPWGVVSNLIARGQFLYYNHILFFYNVIFLLALVAVDNMKDGKSVEEVSSEESTIDIMSSGDEHIDITNDLDPPESSTRYITETNGSASELAQRYILHLIRCTCYDKFFS